MAEQTIDITRPGLRGPRAAAVAGILFSILFGTGYTMIQLTLPRLTSDSAGITQDQLKYLSLGLSFLPFAGMAFLWFMAVLREHMGALEDQFFSTLYLGSGFLYIGMVFTAAAVGTGLMVAYSISPEIIANGDAYLLARSISQRITTIYTIRMAGMFMTVLGTIWVRTQLLPRWLALLTFIFAVVLLISIGFSPWVMLVFPVWVVLISTYILYLNYLIKQGDLQIDLQPPKK